jgi:subtilisin family serine protease
MAGDLRWLLLVTLTLIVTALLSGPAAGAGVFRNSDDRTAASTQASSYPAYASGHILVGSRTAGDDATFEKALAKGGAHSLGKIAQRVHVVDVAPGDEQAAVARLRADPNVEFAEVDRLIPAAGVTNDPMSGSEWHLSTIGAPTAWAYTSGAGITIAILDTGVDGTHPDLAANMVPGWNFYDNNSDTHDVNGHGTMVAGTAAAVTNNGVGVAAVAGAAKIMPIRIADPSAYALWSTVAQGITYAADHGARVVNLSYQGASSSSTIQQAASYLRSKGGVLFVAAGNTGAVDNTAPTDLMMVVAATLADDSHASWSTYGSFVDISAPGYNIVSTAPGGSYWYCWGTSLSTPIVAGTAALILAKRPDFTPAQVDAALKSTATDLGASGPDIYFGAGRVNAAAALQQAASSSTSTADTTKPSVAIASPTVGTVSGTVTFSINASDNVGVSRVELRINGALVGTDTASPWQFGWNSASVANGSVTVTATAYDAAGNSSVSPTVTLNVSNATLAPVDTTVPSVAIASPTGGSVGGSVKVSVNATDNVGVTRVELLVNSTVIASSNVAPFAFTWNTSAYTNGAATLTARAYDAAGNVGTSANVVVNVANSTSGTGVSDTTPPSVAISNPLDGTFISSTMQIRASASDNAGTSGMTMKLYIDGALVTSVRGATLSYKWNPRKVGAGTHTITVTATDAAGNTGSSAVHVTR